MKDRPPAKTAAVVERMFIQKDKGWLVNLLRYEIDWRKKEGLQPRHLKRSPLLKSLFPKETPKITKKEGQHHKIFLISYDNKKEMAWVEDPYTKRIFEMPTAEIKKKAEHDYFVTGESINFWINKDS